jgi:hypothetical protein
VPQFSQYCLKASRWKGSIWYRMMQVSFMGIKLSERASPNNDPPSADDIARMAAALIAARRPVLCPTAAPGAGPQGTKMTGFPPTLYAFLMAASCSFSAWSVVRS